MGRPGLRIRGKLIVGLGAVLALTLVLGGYAAMSVRLAGDLTEQIYGGSVIAIDASQSAMIDFVKLDRTVSRILRDYETRTSAEDLDELKDLEARIVNDLDIVKERTVNADVLDLIS